MDTYCPPLCGMRVENVAGIPIDPRPALPKVEAKGGSDVGRADQNIKQVVQWSVRFWEYDTVS